MAGEWSPINLGDVCRKIGSGATPRGGSDVYLERGPYALIRSQNVYNDGFHHDGLAYIGEQHAAELANVEVLEGDVLLNITGDSVARACQVDKRVLPARVNQHVAIIRPDKERLDPRFLRYFLVSPETQSKLLSWAGSGGTRNALTKGMIEAFDVLAPESIDQQRAIAHILATLDDKIELNQRMSETLEAMARALFKSWFVDFQPVRAKVEGREPGLPGNLAELFPDALTEHPDLGVVPKGWNVSSLRSYTDVVRGLSYKGSGLSDDGMPMHNLNSIYEGGGYKRDGLKRYSGEYKQDHVARAGDLIVANTEQGHHRLLIGYAAIVPTCFEGDSLFSHHIYRVRVKSGAALTSDYLCHLFNTSVMHDTVSGYANGTTVNMLPMDGLQCPLLVVPPPQVVGVFTALAKGARLRCESMIDESRTLAALRAALLPRLMTGELRVTDSVPPRGGASSKVAACQYERP